MERVLWNRKGQQVRTPYTDDEAIQRLELLFREEGDDFARDLCRRGRRFGLTPSQAFWVHKLVIDRERPEQAAPASIPDVGRALIAMFDSAAQHLKWPKIRFQDLLFTRAGEKSREPGAVNITTPEAIRDQRRYMGRVRRDGSFVQGAYCDAVTRARILEILADPGGLAAAHGRQVGSCCFCSRALTDERSTSVGYGPICAARFGLPWGEGLGGYVATQAAQRALYTMNEDLPF